MGAGAVWVTPIAMVLDINAIGGVQVLTVTYRVDLTCLFPEHFLQFLGHPLSVDLLIKKFGRPPSVDGDLQRSRDDLCYHPYYPCLYAFWCSIPTFFNFFCNCFFFYTCNNVQGHLQVYKHNSIVILNQ